MAYNSNASYIPPRRAYYEIPQQHAPTQNGYGGQAEQYHDPHASQKQYEQGYYDQQHGQWGGEEYSDMRPAQILQSSQHAHEHYGNARSQKQPSARQQNGYASPQQQQQQQQQQQRQRTDAQYDTRYQQQPAKAAAPQYEPTRPERGRQPNYNQQQLPDRSREQRSDRARSTAAPQSRPEPQAKPQQQMQMPAQESRPNPRNARQYPGESRAQPSQQAQVQPQLRPSPQNQPQPQSYSQLSVDLPPPPKFHDNGRPMSAPGPDRRDASPGKMSMAEWKAKERAKMHAASAMPDTVAQDNAFPMFPTKRDRSKARSGTSSARASGELPRPGTASSNNNERRPSKPRTHSDTAATLDALQPPSRTVLDKPRTYSDTAAAVGGQQQPNRPILDLASTYHNIASAPVEPPQPGRPTLDKSRTYSEAASSNVELPQPGRPMLERLPHSFSNAIELPAQPMSPRLPPDAAAQARTSPQFDARKNTGSPARQKVTAQQQQSPPVQNDRWQPPPQPNSAIHNYPEQSQMPYQQRSEAAQHPRPLPSTTQAQSPSQAPPVTSPPPPQYERAPASLQNESFAKAQASTYARQQAQSDSAPQLVESSLPRQQQQPLYFDHQPLSPAPLQPRPSTAHAQHSLPTPPATSPLPVLSQSEVTSARNRDAGMKPAQQPWDQQQSNQAAYNRNIGQYHSGQMQSQVAQSAPPQTREEEIEAEMPDFDSAAPGGTSLLHKRSQQRKPVPAPVSIPAPPPAIPVVEIDSNPRSPISPEHVPYNQQQSQIAPAPVDQRRRGENPANTEGYVYGLPGQNNPRKFGAAYGQPPGQQPQQQAPPRPPFADERPRRSMDDARQMSNRQGPAPPHHHYQQQQLMAQQWQQPPAMSQPRPLPTPQPQARQQYAPGAHAGGRNHSGLSVQTSWPDVSGQGSINSAPPTQQGFREFPRPPQNGMPETRQKSNPRQPAPEQNARSPDSLPHHPTPVRPGHMDRSLQSQKPVPVRHHDNAPAPEKQRQVSSALGKSTRPVTAAELEQLQSVVNANPNDHKRAMLLVKKLVEASTVLASDGGRADRQTQTRNRERYVMEADRRLRKLVAANYPDAQFYLADCYGQGLLGLKTDSREAFKLYQTAAKAGHAQAAYRTAMCCELGPEDGGTTQDYGKAVQWFRRGADLGDSDAMFKIGIILLKGLLGQAKNVGEAITFLKRAVDQSGSDNPQALYELAQLYESDQRNPEVRNKVIPDDKYAFDLFQQAGTAGHRAAQFRLGQAYEYGSLGATIDNRASITWYTKAAAQGDHQAELALSGWYLTGADGILQQSDTEAYLWARKAAASDHPQAKAMFAMGYFTETGIGCPKSMEEAKKWYSRAAAYKFPKAQERLEELKRTGSKTSRPVHGKLSRKDQKKDEENCVVM